MMRLLLLVILEIMVQTRLREALTHLRMVLTGMHFILWFFLLRKHLLEKS